MRRSRLALVSSVAPIALVAGCWARGPAPADPAVTDPQVLYDQHCARCHARAKEPGGPQLGGSKGPSLAKIGAARGRTAESIAAFIRDPKGQDPDARLMPAFAEVLSDEQIRILAEWLAAKK
jgi:mono/diheme cytochrome c family protein